MGEDLVRIYVAVPYSVKQRLRQKALKLNKQLNTLIREAIDAFLK